jgi:hypothetical protein
MDELENFKSKYRAHIQEGNRRYVIPKRVSVDYLNHISELAVEYEFDVQINMSKADFEHLIGMESYFESKLRYFDWNEHNGIAKSIIEQHERELRIRNENPAAKLAYEKYRNIMNIVDGHGRY